MIDRRSFLKAGLAGSALLAAGGLAAWFMGRDATRDRDEVLAALIPVLLAGALPEQDDERARAVGRCTLAVGKAVEGLSPAAQQEAGQLFALLSIAPTRALTTGITGPWAQASPQEIGAFLDRWRFHSWALLQTGYQALHDLVTGSWYADEAAWPAIGYGGPLKL
jgi:hypothetical protein